MGLLLGLILRSNVKVIPFNLKSRRVNPGHTITGNHKLLQLHLLINRD